MSKSQPKSAWDGSPTSGGRIDWTREELILALDLYLTEGGLRRSHPKVIELAGLICLFPLHRPDAGDAGGRTPSAVARKLGNLSNFDPSYSGAPTRGSHLDRTIWDEWSHRPVDLHKTAVSIRAQLLSERD